MKAFFNRGCDIELCVGFDEDGECILQQEWFAKGTPLEFEIIGHPTKLTSEGRVDDETKWNIQFNDGTMVMALDKTWLDIAYD